MGLAGSQKEVISGSKSTVVAGQKDAIRKLEKDLVELEGQKAFATKHASSEAVKARQVKPRGQARTSAVVGKIGPKGVVMAKRGLTIGNSVYFLMEGGKRVEGIFVAELAGGEMQVVNTAGKLVTTSQSVIKVASVAATKIRQTVLKNMPSGLRTSLLQKAKGTARTGLVAAVGAIAEKPIPAKEAAAQGLTVKATKKKARPLKKVVPKTSPVAAAGPKAAQGPKLGPFPRGPKPGPFPRQYAEPIGPQSAPAAGPAGETVPMEDVMRGAGKKPPAGKAKGLRGLLKKIPKGAGTALGWGFLAWMVIDLVKKGVDKDKEAKLAALAANLEYARQSQTPPDVRLEQVNAALLDAMGGVREQQSLEGAYSAELMGILGGREGELASVMGAR